MLSNHYSANKIHFIQYFYLLGMLPPSVTASHHRLKPTVTMVLDRNTAHTTNKLISRFKKALNIELWKSKQKVRKLQNMKKNKLG